MLSSIHPLGERAKHNSFGLTATSFVIASALGGATTGLVLGLAAESIAAVVSARVATYVFGIAAVTAAIAELGGVRLPSWRRQVSEDWLTTYRGWVYGAGFGLQLGSGLVTIITTAAIPLALLAAVLSGSWIGAVAVWATFGLVRGLTILAAAGVDSPESLFSFHQRLQQRSASVRTGAGSAMAATGLAVALTSIV